MTKYSFFSGQFTEYTTFFLYISDIFLLLALFFWLVVNKNLEKYLNFKKFGKDIKLSKIWLSLFLFLFWLFLTVAIKNNYIQIEIYQLVRSIELILLLIYIYFNLNSGKKLFNALYIISFSGFLQGIIAISQFINQQSIFKSEILRKAFGESIISPETFGVAKLMFEGQKVIRSYGTFPHPNILGGFLLFSTLITIFLYLESKNSYLSSKINSQYLFLYNNINQSKSQSILYSAFWTILIFIQITALFFTFSRTIWFSFLLSVLILTIFSFYFKIVSRETVLMTLIKNALEKFKIFILKRKEIVSRETISCKKISIMYKFSEYFLYPCLNIIKSLTKWKEIIFIFILSIFLITSYTSFIAVRINKNIFEKSNIPNNYALSDRIFYNNVSRETIANNFIFGSGIGSFVLQIDNFVENRNIYQKLEPWQYQPAHNIYFLIASEVGIMGLLFFLLFVFFIISNLIKGILIKINYFHFQNKTIVSRETLLVGYYNLDYFLLVIILSFLFIGLFDHYFWTIQQGKLMFWLVLGLMLTRAPSDRQ